MEEVQEAANGKSDLDQRHIRNTRTRVCKRCKFSTANAKEFLHHQISAHDEDMEVHGCDKCDFVTSSYTELVCHKRNHRRSSNASLRKMSTDSETGFIDDSNNNDKTLGVAAGSMTTTSASTRDAVAAMVNGHERPNPHASARADTDSPIPIGQNVFECAECDVTTSSAKTYFWHLKEEHGATFDVFECSQCDFATRDRALLATHQSGHTNNEQDSADESSSVVNAESLNGDPIPPKVIEIVPDSVKKDINDPQSDSIPDDMKSSTSIIGDLINRVSGGNPELAKASFMGKMELTYGGPAVFPNGFGSSEGKNEHDALMVDDRRRSLPNFSTPKNNPLYPQQPPFLKVSHSSLEKSKPAGVKSMTPGATTKPKTGCAPVREAVDPAKYVTIQEPDGTKYACSKCGNIYKWRKSLNKHWKEKHDGEIPDPRPNYTALNIPRLKATNMGGTPPGSVLKEVHSGMDASAARQVAASRAALMSGGDVKMGEISNKSPALRRALKRPAMTGEPPFSGGLSLPNKPTETNSLLKYSHGVQQFTSTMLHPSQTIVTDDQFSNYNALKSLHATSANLAKYNTPGASTIKQHTIQKTRHLVSHRGGQPSRESPMDLSKQILQGKLAILNDDYHSDSEGALDLSKGSAGIIHISKQPKMMSVIDVDQLPQQDEPLDFSMKPTKPEPALKQEEMFRLVPEQTGSLALQCPSCAYIARNKQDYDNHMELHLRKRHHKCAECQQVFFTMTELNYHFSNEHATAIDERMMTGGNGQRMLVPGKVQEATQLYKYLTMDSQGQLLTCMVCGTIFQWQWTLAKHFSEDHPTLPNPYTKKSGSASTTSPNPSAVAAEPSPAKRQKLHEDVDEGPAGNPLQCHQCAFVAGSNSELARHQLKHSIARQYVCRVCSFTTRWKDQLISHYKQNHPTASLDLSQISMQTIHDQVTPPPSGPAHSMVDMTPEDGTTIVIPQAPEDSDNDQHSSGPEDSPNRNNLEAQQQALNNSAEILLPFKCSVCEYRARWPSEITQHMKNHSDEKPYLCPRCSYRSKWKWDVVKHLKRCGGGTVKDVIDTTKHRKQRQIQALLADVIPATNLKIYKTGPTHSPGSGREVLSNGPPNVTVVPALHMSQGIASLDLSASSGYEDSIYEHGHINDMSDESESYTSDHQQISAGSGDDGGNNPSYSSLLGQGQHFCLHCPFVGNSPAELKRHSRVHSDEKPFICKTCGYCSKWKCDLKKHLRTYNHTSAVPLTYGGHGRKPSDWKDSLSKSSEKQEAEFGEEEEEDKEAEDSRRMSLPTLYKCDKCQYVTYKKNVLDSHMKIHRQTNVTLGSSGSGKLKCKQCDFTTNDLISFVQHKLTHSSQQTSESALNMVDGNAQEKQETNNNDPTTESNVLAPDASVAVKHRRKPLKGNRILAALGSDMHEHTSKADEDFDDLSYKAEEATEPSSHMALDFSRKTLPVGTVAPMVQEGSKKVSRLPNYKCTFCPYTTDNKCNFEKHTRFHNTPNKYTCEWCNWSIDRLNLLYRHAQIVHPEELALQEKETFFGKVRGRKSSPGLGLFDRDSASREFGDNSEGNTDRYDTDDICDESDGSRDLLGVRRRLSMSGKRPREDGEDENRSKRRRRLKTCQKCGYITDNVTTLQRHMAKHGSMGKFTCTYCDYSVDRQHIVDYHMKIVHLCQDDALRLQAAEDERQTLLAEGMKKKAIVGGQVENSDIEKDLVIADAPDEVEQLDKDVNMEEDGDVGKLVIATDPEEVTEDPEEMMTEDQEEMTEDPEEMTEESEAIEEEEESFVPITGSQAMSALNDKIHTVKDGEIVEEEMVDQVSGKTKKVLWEITKIKGHRMKVQRVGNKTTYHCLQCPFITKNITNSANHMRQHGAKKKYVCEYCDYSLDQLRHIMAHMKNVHGAQGTYIEGDDSLEGENISGFNDTTEEEEIENDENEENIDMNSADLHFVRKSSGSLTPKSDNPRKAVTNPGSPKSNGHTRYRCNRCSFVTQVQASWKRHMASHKRFGPKLQCRGCDYKATTAKLMRQHLRTQHSHKAVAKN